MGVAEGEENENRNEGRGDRTENGSRRVYHHGLRKGEGEGGGEKRIVRGKQEWGKGRRIYHQGE